MATTDGDKGGAMCLPGEEVLLPVPATLRRQRGKIWQNVVSMRTD